jgi:hypothetical protein
LGVACTVIDPDKNTQAILSRLGTRALNEAQSAWTAHAAIVTSEVGGTKLGTISANTPVRIICRENGDFVLIKQERGNPDGVVEISALEGISDPK